MKSDIVQRLERLNSETTSLLVLTHQIGREIRTTLAQIERPAANGGINPNLCAGALADALWAACGRHKTLVLRTRITQRAGRSAQR